MGDEQHRRPRGLLHVAEHLHHLCLDGDVEGSGGFVGDEDLRLVGNRHGNHRALTHATGVLVRELIDASPRFGHADEVEQLDGSRSGRLLGDIAVGADGLDDLRTDGEHRVEGGHRVLEDHRDVVTAHRAHVSIRERQQVAPLEHGPSRDAG